MNRENYHTTSVSEYFKLSLTIPLFDTIFNELKARFSKEHRIHGNGFFIVPFKVVTVVKKRDYLQLFATQYASDLPNILRLESVLDLWERYWKKEHEIGKDIPDNIIDTIATLCDKGRETWYPNIYTILVLIGVVPGSSCSCE